MFESLLLKKVDCGELFSGELFRTRTALPLLTDCATKSGNNYWGKYHLWKKTIRVDKLLNHRYMDSYAASVVREIETRGTETVF